MTKTIVRLLSTGLRCLALWPTTVLAQSDPLREAYNQYNALYGQGRYDEAEPFAHKALELGTEKFGPDYPTTAVFINNLAALYRAQGKYAEAEPLYQRALAIREKAVGPGHPDVATNLENYAALLRKTGFGDESEKLEARSKAIRAKHATENPVK